MVSRLGRVRRLRPFDDGPTGLGRRAWTHAAQEAGGCHLWAFITLMSRRLARPRRQSEAPSTTRAAA
jgi:hypothetical protein